MDTHEMTIAAIREQHRERVDHHRAEKALTLQIKARCRRFVGGDKTEADKLYTAMMALRDGKKPTDEAATLLLLANQHLLGARDIVEKARQHAEDRAAKLATSLPIWTKWAKDVRGLGPLSIAQIVGEAGDVGNYRTVSGLWKRMGLAVINGGRQRRVKGDEALLHGYSPQRRSIVWNIGNNMIRSQRGTKIDEETGEITQEADPYRAVYDQRKAYEHERDPEITKGHAHNRAKRYMEKRLLREMWKAWRRVHPQVDVGTKTSRDTPADVEGAADPEPVLMMEDVAPSHGTLVYGSAE